AGNVIDLVDQRPNFAVGKNGVAVVLRREAPTESLESPSPASSDLLGKYLSYQDAPLPTAEKERALQANRSSPAAKRYARVLRLMELKGDHGKPLEAGQKSELEAALELAKSLRKAFRIETLKNGLVVSPFGKSESWVMWDIAKQKYYFSHPEERREGYEVADPLTSEDKQEEIVNRQLGFEVYQAFRRRTLPEALRRRIEENPPLAAARSLLQGAPNASGSLSSKDLAALGKYFRTGSINELLNKNEEGSSAETPPPEERPTPETPPSEEGNLDPERLEELVRVKERIAASLPDTGTAELKARDIGVLLAAALIEKLRSKLSSNEWMAVQKIDAETTKPSEDAPYGVTIGLTLRYGTKNSVKGKPRTEPGTLPIRFTLSPRLEPTPEGREENTERSLIGFEARNIQAPTRLAATGFPLLQILKEGLDSPHVLSALAAGLPHENSDPASSRFRVTRNGVKIKVQPQAA
ncbi:MAG: hypothetical protein JO026_02545, partial [Patescibacteria group bacterium]|nr:hypothetical protein [Patescibacteria group bacterium]